MAGLSPEELARWRRDGFLFPFPCLDEAGLARCRDGLARFEAWLGAPVNAARDLSWRTMPHLALPWAAELGREPAILDRVESILGPDLLLWTSTIFIKEPRTPTIAAWHQDQTYYGFAPPEEVTVWVALTEASHAAGCMDALPFDGPPRQMRHAAHVVENSVNRSAQVITEPLDDSRAVTMALRAGEFSMHHGLTPHRSGPNTASFRRIGLGLNYVPARAKPTGAIRTAAMLVRGEDRYGHFEPLGPPKAELDAGGVAAHALAVERYSATYREQEALHEGRA